MLEEYLIIEWGNIINRRVQKNHHPLLQPQKTLLKGEKTIETESQLTSKNPSLG